MKKESKLTNLLAMMVLLVFALCVVLVLMTGTRVYQRLLDRGESGFTSRTAMRYIATRVHQAQSASVQNFDGCTALAIPEEIDGERYCTLVYWYDGYIRELYCAEGAKLHPEDGEKVLQSQELGLSVAGGILTAQLGGNTAYLRLPSGEETIS